MPSYLDLALLGIVLVSALLSMVRGFTREVLAIASWAAAAVAAYYLHPAVMPYLENYIQKDQIRQIVAVAIVFFATLIVVSVITVKLSDAILDSKVGPLDRTLGFIFGAARGFLLGVVAFLFFNWLVPKAQPEWIANARSRPVLQLVGDDLMAMLPLDAENAILKRLKHDKGNPNEEVPADEADPKPIAPPAPTPPVHKTDMAPATTPKPTSDVSATDKQRLDNILGKPAAPATGKKL